MPPWLALVQRELLRTLRKVRAFFFLVCVALIAAWVLLEAWPGGYTPSYILGYRSEDILVSVILTLYFAGLILMPAYGAGSLVAEREQHTWDLLGLTLIRPAEIVLGKLVNTLGLYALLSIAVLPIAATVFFLVGVDWLLLARLCPIVAVTAFWSASIGVMCSAWQRATVPAVIASFICVAFLLGAYLIPVFLVADFYRVRVLNEFLETVAPVLSSMAALVYSINGEFSLLHYAAALTAQIGYGAVALFVAWLAIRRPREDRLPGLPRETVLRRVLRVFFGASGGRKPACRPLSDRVNPMFAKEMRWGWQSRRKLRLLVFAGLLAAQAVLATTLWAVLPNVNASERAAILGIYWSTFVLAIVAVATPALLANTLSKEYERENIDALRMTLMRPGTIVRGKL